MSERGSYGAPEIPRKTTGGLAFLALLGLGLVAYGRAHLRARRSR